MQSHMGNQNVPQNRIKTFIETCIKTAVKPTYSFASLPMT